MPGCWMDWNATAAVGIGTCPTRRRKPRPNSIYFLRRDSADLTYLLYPDQWELDRLNGALDVSVRHRYSYGRVVAM
jgi:hypothetical protein